MNTKILPYFRSQFWRLFVILFTAPSFSVRKFVWLCTHHLTIYLTILHSFLSVSSRRCGACAAPSAEHARPQASNTIQVSKEFGFIDHRIIHYNEYGLPYLKYLFLDAMTVSKTRLYTYINADIFVNINILQAAEAYYQYRKDGVLIERITNK